MAPLSQDDLQHMKQIVESKQGVKTEGVVGERAAVAKKYGYAPHSTFDHGAGGVTMRRLDPGTHAEHTLRLYHNGEWFHEKGGSVKTGAGTNEALESHLTKTHGAPVVAKPAEPKPEPEPAPGSYAWQKKNGMLKSLGLAKGFNDPPPAPASVPKEVAGHMAAAGFKHALTNADHHDTTHVYTENGMTRGAAHTIEVNHDGHGGSLVWKARSNWGGGQHASGVSTARGSGAASLGAHMQKLSAQRLGKSGALGPGATHHEVLSAHGYSPIGGAPVNGRTIYTHKDKGWAGSAYSVNHQTGDWTHAYGPHVMAEGKGAATLQAHANKLHEIDKSHVGAYDRKGPAATMVHVGGYDNHVVVHDRRHEERDHPHQHEAVQVQDTHRALESRGWTKIGPHPDLIEGKPGTLFTHPEKLGEHVHVKEDGSWNAYHSDGQLHTQHSKGRGPIAIHMHLEGRRGDCGDGTPTLADRAKKVFAGLRRSLMKSDPFKGTRVETERINPHYGHRIKDLDEGKWHCVTCHGAYDPEEGPQTGVPRKPRVQKSASDGYVSVLGHHGYSRTGSDSNGADVFRNGPHQVKTYSGGGWTHSGGGMGATGGGTEDLHAHLSKVHQRLAASLSAGARALGLLVKGIENPKFAAALSTHGYAKAAGASGSIRSYTRGGGHAVSVNHYTGSWTHTAPTGARGGKQTASGVGATNLAAHLSKVHTPTSSGYAGSSLPKMSGADRGSVEGVDKAEPGVPSKAAHNELTGYGWQHQGGGVYTHPHPALKGHKITVGGQGTGGVERGAGGRPFSYTSFVHHDASGAVEREDKGVQALSYHLMKTNQRAGVGSHDDGYTGRGMRKGYAHPEMHAALARKGWSHIEDSDDHRESRYASAAAPGRRVSVRDDHTFRALRITGGEPASKGPRWRVAHSGTGPQELERHLESTR